MKKGVFFAVILLALAGVLLLLPWNNTSADINETKILDKENYVSLTNEEAEYIINFLTDFLIFSKEDKLDIWDRGFPKQFYLYDKDMVISLGDMLLLFFEKQAYEIEGISYPTYFIPKNQSFKLVNRTSDVKEGYEFAIKGSIPKKISEKDLQSFVYQTLTGDDINFNYEIGDLNRKYRGIDIAFTFDIESGRYSAEASEIAISPCKDDNYSLGLEEDEKICDNPAYVAWMSPRDDKVTYTQYPYPQVSGILGFEEILDYSERYGIPTTNYIVKKDIVAFDILNKELVNRAKSLVKKGLFEVGSHTRYHTHLNMVDEELAKKELIESRLFLEEFFNTAVFGIRGPYLSMIGDSELAEAGYSYYSNAGSYFGKVPCCDLINKPWNGEEYTAYTSPARFKKMMKEKEYIITLDHPWNMVYQDGDILTEDPEIKDNYRAIILTAISNGGILVMAKDIK